MKVSIITATYNSAHGIGACLDSILSQDYKNIECLVIDGNSKDETIEIVLEKQKRENEEKKHSAEERKKTSGSEQIASEWDTPSNDSKP